MYSGGSGTKIDPYLISTAQDLYDVRENRYSYFKQTADIDLATSDWAEGWEAIGSPEGSFYGYYDGDTKKVKNMILNDASYAGLFGALYSAEIKNVVIENFEAITCVRTGGLAGSAYFSTIEDCSVSGEITSKFGAYEENTNGGVIGQCLTSIIKHLTSNVTISGTQQIGGMFGFISDCTIEHCSAEGSILITYDENNSPESIGMFAGEARRCHVLNCKITSGTIETEEGNVNENQFVGGFIGNIDTLTIKDSYAIVDITLKSSADFVGGFVGLLYNGDVERCYCISNIRLASSNSSTGGFIGKSEGNYLNTFKDCFAMSNILKINVGASLTYVGGFVGLYDYGQSFIRCYCVGTNEATSNSYGFCGYIEGTGSPMVIESYYDTTVSGLTDTDTGLPKTTTQLKTESTYTGWDFVDIWKIDTENNGYPSLRPYVESTGTEGSGLGMLVSEMLSLIDDLRPGNKFSSTTKLKWINEVEGQLWNEVYKYKNIQTSVTAANYSLPSGVSVENIKEVYAGSNLVPRTDMGMKDTTGYYYDKTSNKIVLYPATGYTSVIIAYAIPFTPKTTSDRLSVVSPYDRMYIEYVSAKINFYMENYESYNNEMETFNQTFIEHATWWKDNGGVSE